MTKYSIGNISLWTSTTSHEVHTFTKLMTLAVATIQSNYVLPLVTTAIHIFPHDIPTHDPNYTHRHTERGYKRLSDSKDIFRTKRTANPGSKNSH